ncbi:helix-turn-helix transcriptional regulator [Clostridium sp. HBUAS56010]|uniref:helix-turn-helix transcriptional regulator n=1 Tax=Clostridium sp. HBUAS56010 TaxID=2571127 RepID=UPI00117735D9|nr:helix-turn-helix transcriptional regulator [Clostridium sp. HBUAS56010]
MDHVFTPQEVADRLRIKKATVYELIKRGELKATKIGKQIRISQEQLNLYLKEPPVPEEPLVPVSDIPPFTASSAIRQTDYLLNTNGLILSSQESRIVELIRSGLDQTPEGLPLLHSYMNDYNSLYSLYYGKTHLALTCFLLEETEQIHNRITNLVPGRELAILSLCSVSCGFYVKKGNPMSIHSPKDLLRPDVRFLNREMGSGYRMYMDSCFVEMGMSKTAGKFQKECLSHMSAANGVALGAADVSIGDLSHLVSYPQLEPVFLTSASMDLVFFKSDSDHPAFQSIVQIVQSDEFKKSLLHFPGYHTANTGRYTVVKG